MKSKNNSIQISSIFIVRLIWSITNLFIDTFMSVYFLQVSDSNLYKLIGYNMMRLIVLCLFFVLLSGIAKSKNRLNLIRVSLIACVCFFITLLILKEESCNYWWLLAIFWGMGTGMYHCGYNSFEVDNLRGISRGKFVGIYESVNHLMKIITPVLFGYIIDNMGFSVDFMVILGLTILHMAGLFVLKDTYDWDNTKGAHLVQFIKTFCHESWFKDNSLSTMFAGVAHSCSALDLLASILILQVVVNSTKVGIVTAIGYGIASICGILFSRLYKNKKLIIKWHWTIAAIYIISLTALFLFESPSFVLLYYFIGRIYRLSSTTIGDTVEGNITLCDNMDSWSQEFYTWGDICRMIGRVTSYLLLLLYFWHEIVVFLFIPCIIFCTYYLLRLSRYLNINRK